MSAEDLETSQTPPPCRKKPTKYHYQKKNPQTPNKQSRDDGVQSTHKRRQATGNFKQPSNGEVLDIRVRQPGEKKNIKECARKVKGDKEVSRVWVLLSINKK